MVRRILELTDDPAMDHSSNDSGADGCSVLVVKWSTLPFDAQLWICSLFERNHQTHYEYGQEPEEGFQVREIDCNQGAHIILPLPGVACGGKSNKLTLRVRV